MTRNLLDSEEVYYTGKIVLNKLSYTRLWLFTAQIGNKQLQYNVSDTTHYTIGGYGLFDDSED